jgi:5-carboxymethyl-2-hydroxymuconate isomerase
MPHCIIEYAKDIEKSIAPQQLLQAVFKGAAQSQLFAKDTDIKTRAIAYQHHQIGEGSGDFLHVTIKILSGRTLDQRQYLSSLVLNELISLNFSETSITIEIVDIEKASYEKKLT